MFYVLSRTGTSKHNVRIKHIGHINRRNSIIRTVVNAIRFRIIFIRIIVLIRNIGSIRITRIVNMNRRNFSFLSLVTKLRLGNTSQQESESSSSLQESGAGSTSNATSIELVESSEETIESSNETSEPSD